MSEETGCSCAALTIAHVSGALECSNCRAIRMHPREPITIIRRPERAVELVRSETNPSPSSLFRRLVVRAFGTPDPVEEEHAEEVREYIEEAMTEEIEDPVNLAEMGMPLPHQRHSMEELMQAEEAILASSAFYADVPQPTVSGRVGADGRPTRPVTGRLSRFLANSIMNDRPLQMAQATALHALVSQIVDGAFYTEEDETTIRVVCTYCEAHRECARVRHGFALDVDAECDRIEHCRGCVYSAALNMVDLMDVSGAQPRTAPKAAPSEPRRRQTDD